MTKKEFAEKLGVSKGYVSQILNGDFDHMLSKISELAVACDLVPVTSFLPIEFSQQILDDFYSKPIDEKLSTTFTIEPERKPEYLNILHPFDIDDDKFNLVLKNDKRMQEDHILLVCEDDAEYIKSNDKRMRLRRLNNRLLPKERKTECSRRPSAFWRQACHRN